MALLLAAVATADEVGGGSASDHIHAQPRRQLEEDMGGARDPSDLDDINDLADLSLEALMQVQVVVTASRRTQAINTVPFAISVITSDDIRAAGARSIPDALRLAPGIDIADLSFGNAAVSPRGFHGFLSNQVLVLVDGRQIFDSVFGGTLWGAWPFQLEDIDRIEVIRGPGGVTWGANAVNGVINIITKDPADQLGLTLSMSGGSRGTVKQYVGYGFQEDNLRMRISGEYQSSDGFRKGGSILRNLEDDYKGGRIGLYAVYEKDEDNTYTFSAGSALVDGGFPPTPLAGFGLRRNSESQASYVMATWQHRIAENDVFKLTGFINDFHASPGVPQIDYRYQQIGFQFSRTFDLNETHTRTWGIDTRTDLLDAGNSDPRMLSKNFVSTGIVGLYLQDEWQVAPRWTLSLGGRIDYEFYGGFHPSARASLSYAVSDDAVFYGAVSRAFQMPAAAGRFMNMPLLNGLAYVTANRDMDPMTLVAYELGYRGRFYERLDTSINFFWHQYDELASLSPQLGPPGLVQNRFDNQPGQASLYGAEFEAKYRVSDKFTLLGNYTYEQLNWDVDKPFADLDYVSPPKHKALLGARYAINEDWRLAGNLLYVDAVRAPNPGNPLFPRRIDPYLRLDLNTEYEFWNDRASLTVGVKNLLDSNHYEGGSLFVNDAQVPRMIFVEFRLRLR